ncbi:unnamed protein product [Durusdinium trenchii]|uniref:RNA-editing substrate-binding complex 6 protein domain-containing protein n=2 Tax=Durusdinium trenchii TaxID=1381693 RepID=A0ABP0JX72_9DINO
MQPLLRQLARPRWIHCRPGAARAALQRSGVRCYVDSIDRRVSVYTLTEPQEVLSFMDRHPDSDLNTFEAALRHLSRFSQRGGHRTNAQIVEDARFHALLSGLTSRLEECDATLLSKISDSSGRFQNSTPELVDLASRLAEVVCQREDSFTARNLATVAISLSKRIRDVETVEFIRNEVLKLIDDLEPKHCNMLLEAFRRWGVFDRQLVDLLVERMTDEVDQFVPDELVEALSVLSRLGLARGFLLRRLCGLAFENLRQFTARELARMSYALARLRFLAQSNVDELVDAMRPELHRLRGSQISEFLFALSMVKATHQLETCRTLAAQYVDSEGGIPQMSGGSLIDYAWSLAAMDLVEDFEKDFRAALEETFKRKVPQNRTPLMKFFDVICALDLEYQHLKIQVPSTWRAACDEADRFEMDRLESSRLHNEVMMRFDQLQGSSKGLKWRLKMQRNGVCTPYRVDMLDEKLGIALDLEIISWPTARHLKHRLLEGKGYRMVKLEYWDWRRARSEEDQSVLLEREVTKALEANPLPLPEE